METELQLFDVIGKRYLNNVPGKSRALLSRFVSVIDRITVIIRRHVSPIKRDRITSSFSKTTQVLVPRITVPYSSVSP